MSRFIVTGAPGSGKSAVLLSLRQKGHLCMDNDIELLIREQSSLVRGVFPWTNMRYFAQNCLGRMWKTHERSVKFNQKIFFDQAIPDLMAYLRSEQAPVIPLFMETFENCRYYPLMFLAPIDSKFFPEENLTHSYTLQEALEIEVLILDTYTQLGFETVKLIPGNPQKSTAMVLEKIQKIEDEIQSE